MKNLNLKTVGIIGGVGPETTCEVYLAIIDYFKKNGQKKYPSILIYNLPFPFVIEKEAIVEEKNSHKMLPYLIDGATILEKAGVDFCILPCNTLHKYIGEIRSSVGVPFLSILEETAKKISLLKISSVGILATGTTVKEKLYDVVLSQEGVDVFYPTISEQQTLSNAIIDLLNGNKQSENVKQINDICLELQNRGAEAILLACTDLQLISKTLKLKIPVIDTTEILIESTIKEMLND